MPSGLLSRLVGRSAIYGISSSLVALSSFLLVPFFVAHLTPVEFGRFALAEVVIAMSPILCTLGAHIAIIAASANEPLQLGRMVGSSLAASLLVLGALSGLWTALHLAAHVDTPGGLDDHLIYLALACAAFDIVWLITGAAFRGQGLAVRFALISIVQAMVSMSCTVILIKDLGFAEDGILIARVLAGAVVVVLAWSSLRQLRLKMEYRAAVDAIKFGAPLLPVTLASTWLAFSPRIALGWFGGTSEVGVFAMNSKIAGVVGVLFVQPFALAWQPFMFEASRKTTADKVFPLTLTVYSAAGFFFAFLIGAVTPQIAGLLPHGHYNFNAWLVMTLCVASVSAGLIHPITIGPYLTRRTAAVLPAYLLSALMSIPLLALGAMAAGSMGVALGLCIIYAIQAAALAAISTGLYPLNWQWRDVATALFAPLGAFSLAYWTTMRYGEGRSFLIPVLYLLFYCLAAQRLWRSTARTIRGLI